MIRIEQGIFYEICKMVAELKMEDDKRRYVKQYSNLLMYDTRMMKGIHMTYEMPPYQIYKEISFVDSAGNWQIIPTGVAVCIIKDSVKVIEETYYIENYREFKQDRTPGFKDMVEKLCLKVL
jgi:hypothetical protein